MDMWKKDGEDFGWIMPSAPWWKKLPVVRHVRAIIYRVEVRQWNAAMRSVGMVRSGYDEWVLYGIACGMETRDGDHR
jgi:hypothetical protein